MLLHGFGLGGFAWDPVLSALQSMCPLIIYDLPGHANSLDGGEPGGAGRIAKAILADLDRRGISAFHLAGHSLGGAAAIIMALRVADRVASLSLIAPGGIGPQINYQAMKSYASAETNEEIRLGLKPLFGADTAPPESLVQSMAAARARPGALAQLQTILKGMLVDDEVGTWQGTLPKEQIASLPMSVAAVWGADDHIVPVDQAALLPANVAVRIIADIGHMPVQEAPDIVIEMLQAQIGS